MHTDGMRQLAIENEINLLRRVVIHTPGPEIEAMTPGEAKKDLYNDIIPLGSVLEEYLQLKRFLSLVSEVHELLAVLSACLVDETAKAEFISDLSRCFPINGLRDTFMAMPPEVLAAGIVQGVPAPPGSLAHRLDERSYISRPLPNAYFMRDSAAVIGDCALCAATAFDVRMVEAVITRFIFKHHPDFKARALLIDGPAERNRYLTIEGGDILVLAPRTFALGVSERTTPYAVESFARSAARAYSSDITVFAVELPKTRATIHLDMVFTMIDRDAALIYKPVVVGAQRGRVFRIEAGKNGKLKYREEDSLLRGLAKQGLDLKPVLCGNGHSVYQQREQWLSGANSFAFAPGKILTYSCNRFTADALAEAGFAIVSSDAFIEGRDTVENYRRLAVTFDGIELARGGGGARCMTLPVEREKTE